MHLVKKLNFNYTVLKTNLYREKYSFKLNDDLIDFSCNCLMIYL
jgi:hypothetical protein